MLLEKGVDPGAMQFSVTKGGKPYIVRKRKMRNQKYSLRQLPGLTRLESSIGVQYYS